MLLKTIRILFVVFAIIATILFFPFKTGCSGGHRIQAIRRDFTTLVSYLDQYQNTGRNGYPTEEQGLEALVKRPTTDPLAWEWVQALPEIPLDPWQNSYRYKFPGSKKENEPELIRAGPDGKFGTEDDLSSQD
jgi:general secretion pathway protein G